jgi:DNA excision repair protein ERCC-4
LPSGDYSIDGCENLIAIERKSLADLYSTLGQNRERFEAEHERLSKFEFAAVVIETSIEGLVSPPEPSRLHPKTVFRTMVSWMLRFRVPWVLAGDRRGGEIVTYRFLEKWWSYKTRREAMG